jgi:hypothetical protein
MFLLIFWMPLGGLIVGLSGIIFPEETLYGLANPVEAKLTLVKWIVFWPSLLLNKKNYVQRDGNVRTPHHWLVALNRP